MATPVLPDEPSFQALFHQRWGHLNDPHVRALAWLLDAPDLLDPAAPRWQGKIATLSNGINPEIAVWLATLDQEPQALHTYLNLQPFSRLGRYAEKLMAFYFQHQGMLVAHGIQVRAGKSDTVGEFDFILRQGGKLLHWEFATKFYLLETSGLGTEPDYFVGPNLADTLGAKMHKIIDRQLSLAQHPAAESYLPGAIDIAQALVKGWLFYHENNRIPTSAIGVAEHHCRGFWCSLDELMTVSSNRFAVLQRLSWLAPAKAAEETTLDMASLQAVLTNHFSQDSMPVLIALLEESKDGFVEFDRGFIVPNDWQSRAGERVLRTVALSSKN
jgi:hypothetical protein